MQSEIGQLTFVMVVRVVKIVVIAPSVSGVYYVNFVT